MELEFVPASKRLLSNHIPQGTIGQSRTLAFLSKYATIQVVVDQQGLASHMFKTRWAHHDT